MIEITHPLNFTFQIEVYNFLDIINCTNIINTEIIGKCKFMWNGVSLVLVHEHSETFKEFLNRQVEQAEMKTKQEEANVKLVPGSVCSSEFKESIDFFEGSKDYSDKVIYLGKHIFQYKHVTNNEILNKEVFLFASKHDRGVAGNKVDLLVYVGKPKNVVPSRTVIDISDFNDDVFSELLTKHKQTAHDYSAKVKTNSFNLERSFPDKFLLMASNKKFGGFKTEAYDYMKYIFKGEKPSNYSWQIEAYNNTMSEYRKGYELMSITKSPKQ